MKFWVHVLEMEVVGDRLGLPAGGLTG